MSEAISTTKSVATRPPLALEHYDLDAHPDGDLMRFCACLSRMRGHLVALERAIECVPAVTVEGRRMKELTL